MIALAPREFHLFQAAGRDFLYLVPSAAIFALDESTSAMLGLLTAQRCQMRPGLINSPRLGQARTAHTLRSLKTRAQPHGFRGVVRRFRISPGRVVSNRETA